MWYIPSNGIIVFKALNVDVRMCARCSLRNIKICEKIPGEKNSAQNETFKNY